MNLAGLLGDDEHTAAEGPYSRVMKTRKWLYLSAITAQVFALNLYRREEFESVVKFLWVPSWWVASGVLFGLIYLLAQYALLSGQLLASYDIVLRERLISRRADDLRQSREAYDNAMRKRQAFEREWVDDQFSLAEAERSQAEHEMQEAQYQLQVLQSRQEGILSHAAFSHEALERAEARIANELEARVTAAREAINRAGERLVAVRSSRPPSPDDEAYRALVNEGDAALHRYRDLLNQEPSLRWGYKAFEGCIDLLRIVPPAIISVLAAMQLTGWFRAIA